MRIQPKAIDQYPWYVRLLFKAQIKKYGEVFLSSQLWALSPRLFLAMSFFFGSLERKTSPISPALRSLILVRISQVNVCSFCIDLNTSILLSRGVSMEKAMALKDWSHSDDFTPAEKLVLEYVEAMTLSDREVTDDLFQKLKTEFSEQEILEITAIAAFQNMSTKFNSALDVPAQGFCTLPE
ncbi:MAG: carboxymuconolactone decarboxylase family protein [Alphaproteobacteria bacterium]|nr:carboxymuconolactone decarboxylase family protein [Alphaproteobacteria bacterium]